MTQTYGHFVHTDTQTIYFIKVYANYARVPIPI